MTARTPEDIDRVFAAALNAAKIDDLTALFEPQATLMPSPKQPVSGGTGIREALAQFIAAPGTNL